MVLEMKAPHGDSFDALLQIVPAFLNYLLSFIYIGIYWNNHHHLLQATRKVSGAVLWANLHLLFWLSLFPFATAWMGENHFASNPTAVYGMVLLMAAIAYVLLQRVIVHADGPDSLLKQARGSDRKGKASLLFYATAIVISFWWPQVAQAIYVLMALLWLVPDRRIERLILRRES